LPPDGRTVPGVFIGIAAAHLTGDSFSPSVKLQEHEKMSKLRLTLAAIAVSLACPVLAHAADERIVKFFKETCGTCHGEAGEGVKGLAPALKANKFVTEASQADLSATILKGRAGDAKRYKDLPSPMPPNSMSDSRLTGLIAYLKTDLQK
jgi:mono/diheme cytochrome c family protein